MGQRKFSDLPKTAGLNKTDILAIERTDGTKQVPFKQLCNAIAVQEITELIKEFPEIEEEDTLSIIGGKINKWHKDALKKIEGLSEDILDSKEEIEANTELGKIAGAQAVKEIFGEINSNLANLFVISRADVTTDPMGEMKTKEITAEFSIPEGYKRFYSFAVCTNGWAVINLREHKLNDGTQPVHVLNAGPGERSFTVSVYTIWIKKGYGI